MTQIFHIEGMTCNGCANRVTRALQEVPGVKSVRVSLAEGTAEIDAAEAIAPGSLIAAVEKKGYKVSEVRR